MTQQSYHQPEMTGETLRRSTEAVRNIMHRRMATVERGVDRLSEAVLAVDELPMHVDESVAQAPVDAGQSLDMVKDARHQIDALFGQENA